jgi:ribosomal protein L29
MTLPKYSELNSLLTTSDIDQELFLLQKNLFDLRIKKSRQQIEKSHVFTHTKRRIAQLKFKKFTLLKVNKEN